MSPAQKWALIKTTVNKRFCAMGNNHLTFATLVSFIQQAHDQLATQASTAAENTKRDVIIKDRWIFPHI
jgi:hypothetical protein